MACSSIVAFCRSAKRTLLSCSISAAMRRPSSSRAGARSFQITTLSRRCTSRLAGPLAAFSSRPRARSPKPASSFIAFSRSGYFLLSSCPISAATRLASSSLSFPGFFSWPSAPPASRPNPSTRMVARIVPGPPRDPPPGSGPAGTLEDAAARRTQPAYGSRKGPRAGARDNAPAPARGGLPLTGIRSHRGSGRRNHQPGRLRDEAVNAAPGVPDRVFEDRLQQQVLHRLARGRLVALAVGAGEESPGGAALAEAEGQPPRGRQAQPVAHALDHLARPWVGVERVAAEDRDHRRRLVEEVGGLGTVVHQAQPGHTPPRQHGAAADLAGQAPGRLVPVVLHHGWSPGRCPAGRRLPPSVPVARLPGRGRRGTSEVGLKGISASPVPTPLRTPEPG